MACMPYNNVFMYFLADFEKALQMGEETGTVYFQVQVGYILYLYTYIHCIRT